MYDNREVVMGHEIRRLHGVCREYREAQEEAAEILGKLENLLVEHIDSENPNKEQLLSLCRQAKEILS